MRINIKAMFGMWIFEILLMTVLALACPEILKRDSAIAGLIYAVLAWIPAFMFERGCTT